MSCLSRIEKRKLNVVPGLMLDPTDISVIERHMWKVSDNGYVVAKIRLGGGKGIGSGKLMQLYLHRFLMSPPSGMVVDHINGNKLDNRRENLRVVTNSANCHNRPFAPLLANVSANRNKNGSIASWQARVHVGGRTSNLGYCRNICDAIALVKRWRSHNSVELISSLTQHQQKAKAL